MKLSLFIDQISNHLLLLHQLHQMILVLAQIKNLTSIIGILNSFKLPKLSQKENDGDINKM